MTEIPAGHPLHLQRHHRLTFRHRDSTQGSDRELGIGTGLARRRLALGRGPHRGHETLHPKSSTPYRTDRPYVIRGGRKDRPRNDGRASCEAPRHGAACRSAPDIAPEDAPTIPLAPGAVAQVARRARRPSAALRLRGPPTGRLTGMPVALAGSGRRGCAARLGCRPTIRAPHADFLRQGRRQASPSIHGPLPNGHRARGTAPRSERPPPPPASPVLSHRVAGTASSVSSIAPVSAPSPIPTRVPPRGGPQAWSTDRPEVRPQRSARSESFGRRPAIRYAFRTRSRVPGAIRPTSQRRFDGSRATHPSVGYPGRRQRCRKIAEPRPGTAGGQFQSVSRTRS